MTEVKATTDAGAGLRAASWACLVSGLILYFYGYHVQRPYTNFDVEVLLQDAAALVIMGLGFLAVCIGAVCGAMGASAAAAAGDRRNVHGLPLLANIIALLAFVSLRS